MEYVLTTSDKSTCPNCKTYVDMLGPSDLKKFKKNPVFFLCWTCKKIFQAGVGPIENLGPTLDRMTKPCLEEAVLLKGD